MALIRSEGREFEQTSKRIPMLKISELSARTGLSTHTLRFYEKHGLISASERSEAGDRYYRDTDVRG